MTELSFAIDDRIIIDYAFKQALKNVDKVTGVPRDALSLILKKDELEFYALYKQSTIGNNTTSQPRFYNYAEKAKWLAWTTLKEMSKTMARYKYLNKLIFFCIDPSIPQDNFWTDFQAHITQFKRQNQRLHRQEQLYADNTSSFDVELPSDMLQIGDVSTYAPLMFIDPNDENMIKPRAEEKEIITIGELKDRCKEMEEFIVYEIRLLKYSLRESMKKITNLEHQTRISPDESDAVLNEKLDEILQDSDQNVKKVVENVKLTYQMITDKMEQTKRELDRQNSYVRESTLVANVFSGHMRKQGTIGDNVKPLERDLMRISRKEKIQWWCVVLSALASFGILEYLLYRLLRKWR